MSFFFFFNDTATTEIYTLSLHDALPICGSRRRHTRCCPASRETCSSQCPGCRSGNQDIGNYKSLATLGSTVYVFGGSRRSEERRVGKECRSRWSPYH